MPTRQHIRVLVTLVAALSAPATPGHASDGVGWRGDGSGIYPATDPPTRWSPTEGVVWRTAMPTWGNASPVLVGDRLFVQAEPTTLLCLRASDGKLLWSRDNPYIDTLAPAERAAFASRLARAEVAQAELEATHKEIASLKRTLRKRKRVEGEEDPRARVEALSQQAAALKAELESTSRFRTPATHDIIGYASSTPVSDGRTVYTLFGNGVVAAFDLDGQRRWIRWLGHTPRMNGNPDGHAASPLLIGGRLIVPYGVLQALDPADGLVTWISSVYRDFGTPTAAHAGGRDLVATPDGRVLDVRDGSPVARDVDELYYVGPLADARRLYFAGSTDTSSQNLRATARAFDLAALVSGRRDPVWSTPLEMGRYYASPLVRDGVFYAISESGYFSGLDAESGRQLFMENLRFRDTKPSIASAGPYLYLSDAEDGRTLVYRAGRQPTRVAENRLEPFRATPFFAGSRMYLRTHDATWCIGR